jgi:hypothetical protein
MCSARHRCARVAQASNLNHELALLLGDGAESCQLISPRTPPPPALPCPPPHPYLPSPSPFHVHAGAQQEQRPIAGIISVARGGTLLTTTLHGRAEETGWGMRGARDGEPESTRAAESDDVSLLRFAGKA